jgi:hypothetical protein
VVKATSDLGRQEENLDSDDDDEMDEESGGADEPSRDDDYDDDERIGFRVGLQVRNTIV